MGIEIDGIKITDAIQASALLNQGFISTQEYESALPKLDSGSLNLLKLAEMRNRNLHKPIIVFLKERVEEFIQKKR